MTSFVPSPELLDDLRAIREHLDGNVLAPAERDARVRRACAALGYPL